MNDESAMEDYSDAKENIRDTIKWLAASYASMAAIVMAGTPFSSIGSLTPLEWRFNTAAVGLMVAFILVLWGLYKTLVLLAPDDLYASDLKEEKLGKKLYAEIKTHSWDLLPRNYSTIEKLLEATRSEEAVLGGLNLKTQKQEYEESREKLRLFNTHLERLLHFALFKRMYERLETQIKPLFCIGAAALVSLFIFAWAANPPKESTTKVSIETGVLDPAASFSPPNPPPYETASGQKNGSGRVGFEIRR
jgi:hypothetical protein